MITFTRLTVLALACATLGAPVAGAAVSADEAAKAQFERNGAALGATNVEDYVAEAKAFVARPPKGTQMATRRNGDVLFYDAASNRFAVATAQGTPRALFKPREGAAYWAEQKAKAGQEARAKASSADQG